MKKKHNHFKNTIMEEKKDYDLLFKALDLSKLEKERKLENYEDNSESIKTICEIWNHRLQKDTSNDKKAYYFELHFVNDTNKVGGIIKNPKRYINGDSEKPSESIKYISSISGQASVIFGNQLRIVFYKYEWDNIIEKRKENYLIFSVLVNDKPRWFINSTTKGLYVKSLSYNCCHNKKGRPEIINPNCKVYKFNNVARHSLDVLYELSLIEINSYIEENNKNDDNISLYLKVQ